jgi:hypothetical protein
MPLDEITNYFRSYDKKSYVVFAQYGNEPSLEDVTRFEAKVGFRFPEEFRQFAVHPLGGVYMEVKEEIWPRPKEYDVGPFWSFLYGVYVYSLSSKAPEFLRMEPAWERMRDAGQPGLVPFLKVVGNADPYCFTAEQRIVIWRHEMPNEPEPVAGSFSEVVMGEIRALEERKAAKVRGEDKKM